MAGALRLPSGDVNLVATKLSLDRSHPNVLTFVPSPGSSLDPLVHLAMNSGDVRLTIKVTLSTLPGGGEGCAAACLGLCWQVHGGFSHSLRTLRIRPQGRASEWAEHVELTRLGAGASAGVPGSAGTSPADSGSALEPAEAAALFESRLKAAMLAEDGQLALSRLAGSTVAGFMPKIETQGQVGTTKWRLVSAPTVPGADGAVSRAVCLLCPRPVNARRHCRAP